MQEPPAPWWKCVVAALPELLLGMQFLLLAVSPKQFGANLSDYTTIMHAEFLALHSTAFLGMIGLWKPENDRARQTRFWVFWGLFALYCALAFAQGLQFFWVFFLVTFATYLGLFMNWRSPSAQLQLGARWALGFLVFIIAISFFDAPKNAANWAGRASVIKAGAMYFLVMGTLEISGLYLRVIPRNAAWLYAQLAKGRKS